MTMRSRERLPIALGIVLVCMILVRDAFALDPTLDISQYAHTSWKVRDGFSKGRITAIAQTTDGYLWLGTEFGLSRFDGVRNVSWQPPEGVSLPNNVIRSLLGARDGRLWVGTTEGLVSWKDGRMTSYPELAELSVDALLEDHQGNVWVGAGASLLETGKLCAIHNGSSQCYGGDGSLGRGVLSLYEDSKATIWATTLNALWRWTPGPRKIYQLPERTGGLQTLTEGAAVSLLIATQSGIKQLVDEKVVVFSVPAMRPGGTGSVLRDRNGGLWIGTVRQGLMHIHHGRTDVFARSDGLSGDTVNRLFEDREGNIWVSTSEGLDRFREFAAATFSVSQGLSNGNGGSIMAGRDGSVWLTPGGFLNRWNNGRLTVYRERNDRSAPQSNVLEIPSSGLQGSGSLFQDHSGRIWVSTRDGVGYLEGDRLVLSKGFPAGNVNSFAEDKSGNLWIADYHLGLFRLSAGHEVEQIPWTTLGYNDLASRMVVDPLQGGLWLGFSKGGIAYFTDGKIRASYGATNGLGKGRVNYLHADQDGTLWAGTEGGLSRLKNGRVATLTRDGGLPCDLVDWVLDDADSFWLYMACGLVRVSRSELNAWATGVDSNENAQRTIQATVFDSSDGVRSFVSLSTYAPHAARSADGKLWFAAPDGVTIVDPRHIPYNNLPPPVHIEQIIADRKIYNVSAAAKGLPPLIRDLQIDYTALSLVAPEKMRFRYKLDGYDNDWQDAGNRRQAFYTNLPPRNYRFRVIASNNSGVWNEAGALLDFSVAPAYYQTASFRLLVVAAVLIFLAALYRLRLRQVARQFDLRMQERMRVAQDLHDTLLQGCLSAAMQLHLVVDHLPDDLPIKQTLTRVQHLMTRVIDEGRVALRGLRFSDPDAHDLEQAFVRTQKEVAAGEEVRFTVMVEGRRRPLHPLIRDEVYRIGREAIVNAFRHARAQHIEVEIDYAPKQLRVIVRDDGCGIDPALASSGREGHFGLSGMRERAERIGGRINVCSRNTAGTEVDLSVPGKVAFQVQPSQTMLWLGKLMGRTPKDVQKGHGR